jgi:hypothetical protein
LCEIVGSRQVNKEFFTVAQVRDDSDSNLVVSEESLLRLPMLEAMDLCEKYDRGIDSSLQVPSLEPSWPTSLSDWALMQENDPYCSAILQKLTNSSKKVIPLHPSSEDARAANGPTDYLFRENSNGVLQRRFIKLPVKGYRQDPLLQREIIQTIIPKNLIRSCIRQHHEGLGHPGRNRTINTYNYFISGIQ